jgi:predicted TPR repeat methyltransferase
VRQNVPPYDGLAPFYDHAMRHVDYGEWAAYVNELLTHHGCRPTSVVDLACGTGSVGFELRALGVPVTCGIDRSAAMLRVARERALRAQQPMVFEERDLRHLGRLGPYGAAICMYDSLNYLLETEDLVACLETVHAGLEAGGVFVFDVCTEQNSLRYFRQFSEREAGPDFVYERHAYYDPATRMQMNDFIIHLEGRAAPLQERHRQRIYRLEEIEAAIGRTALEPLGVFDGFTLQPGSEASDRVHFAVRRPVAPTAR